MRTTRRAVILVMKQSQTRKDHRHTIFVTGGDDIFIAVGAARLQNIFHSAFGGTVNRVTEREEGIRAEHNIDKTIQPGTTLFAGQLIWNFSKHIRPILFLGIRDIRLQELVNGVVTVRTFNTFLERQRQNRWMLAQTPQVGLGSSETGAVDTGLLPRTDADGLS